jgi:hypothetical protein
MASFGDIFSTTWKVLLALFLISLGIGFIYLVIGVIGRSGGGDSHIGSDERTRNYHAERADAAYTTMPKSQWDRGIERCIKEHTVIEGMTKDQVKQAVGGGEPWSYSIVTLKGSEEKCMKYEGEQCAEYPPDEVKHFSLHFTPKGNLIWDEDSIGLSVYGKHLPNLPVPQPVPLNDSGRATIGGTAQIKGSTGAHFDDSDQAVEVASANYHLDPGLLSIVLNVGSEFNVRPLSPQRAAQHLHELLERYNFDLVKALAAYKDGPELVDQYHGVPPEKDIRAFVARVVHGYNERIKKRAKTPDGFRAMGAAAARFANGRNLSGHHLAILSNGYSILHDHRLVMGATTRLYYGTDDSSFSDVPTADITGYETDFSVPTSQKQ